jgi:peptidoglycan lytic transglycosylase G
MTRKLAIIAASLALVALIGATFGYYFLLPAPVFQPPRIVSIRKGESVRTIAGRLAAAGVIRNPLPLLLWAKFIGVSARLQPGDYAFHGGEPVADVLLHLVNGDFLSVSVRIPEGLTVHQIAERLEQYDLICDGQFEKAAREGPLVTALGLESLGAEGYLFPATYRFSPFAGADRILAAMLTRFYATQTPAVEQRMFELGINARELVTLASIIEKEAKVSAERPLIAGVFYNRLRLNMPLQSDPTAQYSLDGEISRAAIAVHTPSAFNTYTIMGLPPGPIANPGIESIRAALYPAATDYLYFVARNDGTHVFSRSLSEHERAIAAISAASKIRPVDLDRDREQPARAGHAASRIE